MTTAELTGPQRTRIILGALERHYADDIARSVRVPQDIVRGLCRECGIRLRKREEDDDNDTERCL